MLGTVPAAWAPRVAALHDKKLQAGAERVANLWLLDLSERMARLRVPVNVGDSELCDLAARCAAECIGRAADCVGGLREARERMAAYCERYSVEPPEAERIDADGVVRGISDRGAVRRMTDPLWWRRRLRQAQGRAIEGEAIRLGYVHKNGEIYASNLTVERRAHQKQRNAATLADTQAINLDTEEETTLAELAERAVSNPRIRRGELMTRVSGFEAVAKGLGHAAEFVTLTCPSSFHSKKQAGGRVVANPKFDGATPREAQGYLSRVWAACRAKLARYGVALYGFRIAEPHHDATPHWHCLFFMPAVYRVGAAMVPRFRAIVRRYFLRQDAGEDGAKKHRVTFKAIDRAKGSAAAYIAKYIAKNIDGFQVQADLEGEFLSAVEGSQRVEAWASTWGIRQFQQIGGPPVGVWRELRRMREAREEFSPILERARQAADCGGGKRNEGEKAGEFWSRYVEVMGGPICRRDARPLRVAYTRQGERWNQQEGAALPAPLTRYGEESPPAVFGVLDVQRDRSHVSRVHRWEVKRGSGVDLRPASPAPRTRVNNCTRADASVPPWWDEFMDFRPFVPPRESPAERETRESWERYRDG